MLLTKITVKSVPKIKNIYSIGNIIYIGNISANKDNDITENILGMLTNVYDNDAVFSENFSVIIWLIIFVEA